MNKKLKIFSFPDRHPNYLQLQIDSYRKYMEDDSTEFIIINASRDNFEEINKICADNNIKSIHYTADKTTNFLNYYVEQLNWFRDNIQSQTDDYILLIHSDMFFINKLNYKKLMENKKIYFNPQYRHNFTYFYMWDGVLLFDSEYFNKNNLIEYFDWYQIPGGDVGGQTYKLLNKLDKNIYSFFEFWNIYSINGDNFDTHLNGNIRYSFNKNLKKLNLLGGEELSNPRKRSFPYQEEKEDYNLYYADKFLKLKEIFVDQYNFLDPIHIDLIQIINQPIEESFILHFKSGSGYQNFYNQDYANHKLEEIRKIIFKE
jgi:hypothetical protein